MRVLRQRGSHQQAAVAPPFDRQQVRRRVFLVDHIMQSGGEIVEDVLFVRQVAAAVPGFAVFAAAANVGDRPDESLLEQHFVAWRLNVGVMLMPKPP